MEKDFPKVVASLTDRNFVQWLEDQVSFPAADKNLIQQRINQLQRPLYEYAQRIFVRLSSNATQNVAAPENYRDRMSRGHQSPVQKNLAHHQHKRNQHD